MSLLVAFVAAGVVSYIIRIAFVLLTTPERLPERVQAGLPYVGPAAMAALATAALLEGLDGAVGAPATFAAFGAAVVLSRWRDNLALVVVGAIAAASISQLVV